MTATHPIQHATFIGLGVMGAPMANHLSQHLSENNGTLKVFNRSPEKVTAWLERFGNKGTPANTLAEAAQADCIVSCIGGDADLTEIMLTPGGILENAKPGTLIIDHSTLSAACVRDISEKAHARGISFIDAPVSGGQAGAEKGALSIMCGGDDSDFQRALPVLQSYAKSALLIGPVGAGQLTKMANQIAVAGVIQGLAEALHFVEQAGIDSDKVVKAISGGAAQSWQMDNRAHTMLSGEYEHGFAVDHMRKDLGIVLSTAREISASLPSTAMIDQYYADVQALGGRRWDTSSLLERLRRLHPGESEPS